MLFNEFDIESYIFLYNIHSATFCSSAGASYFYSSAGGYSSWAGGYSVGCCSAGGSYYYSGTLSTGGSSAAGSFIGSSGSSTGYSLKYCYCYCSGYYFIDPPFPGCTTSGPEGFLLLGRGTLAPAPVV